jgi:tricorn protease
VEPDIVVDNLPHATFKGEDAQLSTAIRHLQDLLKEKPIEPPKPPQYPKKWFGY